MSLTETPSVRLHPTGTEAPPSPATLAEQYRAVRVATERLAEPLSPEDQTVQSMPDASPTKWHRAHTTWFFETFVLLPRCPGYTVYSEDFQFLFNSYYEAVGPRHERNHRGMITRPGIGEVAAYRQTVDEAMAALLEPGTDDTLAELVVLGLNHEQQHQELLLMDIKHALAANPLKPAYLPRFDADPRPTGAAEQQWSEHAGGLVEVGHAGEGFHYDNEGPRHKVWLEPYRIASSLVTNAEWLAFIADGGYRRPELWLSDGWRTVQTDGWAAPLYWERGEDGQWLQFGLGGLAPVRPEEPVSHVSHYEADAFARWAGRRLPTEFEWEHAAREAGVGPDTRRQIGLRPGAAPDGQWQGQVWQWTASPYVGYRGYAPPAGAVGEYNGKFMSGQMTLRGGACVTPVGHTRITYRNFFGPACRWPFAGLRLAEDA
ncbi:MAG: ergothioneine biosynthesis protein EgtB [Segniliparus sp.]|uniref:ergothioneine biosynthesis protein EgtB n=1 Tax=Segniliparus sp. TaxID=2804064 RepID=UPI003F313C55